MFTYTNFTVGLTEKHLNCLNDPKEGDSKLFQNTGKHTQICTSHTRMQQSGPDILSDYTLTFSSHIWLVENTWPVVGVLHFHPQQWFPIIFSNSTLWEACWIKFCKQLITVICCDYYHNHCHQYSHIYCTYCKQSSSTTDATLIHSKDNYKLMDFRMQCLPSSVNKFSQNVFYTWKFISFWLFNSHLNLKRTCGSTPYISAYRTFIIPVYIQ